MMATVADDAIFMMDEAPAVFGKATIEALGRPWFAHYEVDEAVTDEEVIVAGDWAFLRGTGTGTMRPKAGGEAIPVRSKAIIILKRHKDGFWKFWRLIANSDLPKRCP